MLPNGPHCRHLWNAAEELSLSEQQQIQPPQCQGSIVVLHEYYYGPECGLVFFGPHAFGFNRTLQCRKCLQSQCLESIAFADIVLQLALLQYSWLWC